jgi:hypothetical protein
MAYTHNQMRGRYNMAAACISLAMAFLKLPKPFGYFGCVACVSLGLAYAADNPYEEKFIKSCAYYSACEAGLFAAKSLLFDGAHEVDQTPTPGINA